MYGRGAVKAQRSGHGRKGCWSLEKVWQSRTKWRGRGRALPEGEREGSEGKGVGPAAPGCTLQASGALALPLPFPQSHFHSCPRSMQEWSGDSQGTSGGPRRPQSGFSPPIYGEGATAEYLQGSLTSSKEPLPSPSSDLSWGSLPPTCPPPSSTLTTLSRL